MAANLAQMKGTIYKMISNPKKLGSGLSSFKKRYGLIRNKKFKYYKDRSLKELGGVFDFDRINCFVMIDDGTGGNSAKNKSHKASPGKSDDGYSEPKRFRIEVIGFKKEFIF